jgi:hypothetical protein
MGRSERKLTKTDELTKSALRFFGPIAIGIYLWAMYYCYSTGHFYAMAIMGLGTAAITAIILFDYFSVGKNYKKDDSDENKDHSQKLPPVQKPAVKVREPEPVMAE